MDRLQLVEFDQSVTFKCPGPFFQVNESNSQQPPAVSTECAEKVEAMLGTAVLHLADLWNMLTLEFAEGVAFDPNTALLTPVAEIPPLMLVAMKSKLENSLEWCQLARSRLTDITRSISASKHQQYASPNYGPSGTVNVQPEQVPKSLWSVQRNVSPKLRTYSISACISLMMDCGTVSMDVGHANQSDGLMPTMQNIVAAVSLGCPLNLKKIAWRARNAEYNPRRFSAVIMRIRDPKTTFLIFASGKMVCTGAKSEEQSKLATRKCARIIQKLGFPVVLQDFKIHNMVGSCDVKFPIRLETLQCGRTPHYSRYEPEVFPGLVFRMIQPKVVVLVFASGKIVLTGAKVREEIYQAFDNIYPLLVANKRFH